MDPPMVLNFFFFLLILFLCPAAISTFPLAKLGCQETCGNISVPYPFGMSNANCYRDSNFQVICNNTYYNPPKLFTLTNHEILSISLQGQQRIYNYVSSRCYDSEGNLTSSYEPILYQDNYFTYSDTENKFTAIGCDTQGYFSASGKGFQTGCMLACPDTSYLTNGSCSGIGCCQISVPKGLRYMSAVVTSINMHKYVYYFNPCSYAFIVDYNWYNYSTSDIKNFSHNIDETGNSRVPIVVDWAINWEPNIITSCDEAMKNQTSYACGNNSVCGNSKNRLGYNCNCSQGHQGNPYLQDGCQGT
ncbi:hypothetical protein NE237_010063 [Protea cynaroides]|uniref:Wall-associated receptor kinase galacturonan-binding domain-containing protein n=1 Tax=Protea cynaroides TaxID=273540 RepID=A0A9Q0KYM4_9MAGN|nr:hypothetical protein NE237_010063 [Protea cynaroides]